MAVPTTTEALVFELVRELNQLRAKRFQWLHEIQDQAIANWKEHFEAFDDWFRRAGAAISDLSNAGHTELASKLACNLLDRRRVFGPGTFSLSMPTGFGRESWHIVGNEELTATWEGRQPSPDIALQQPRAHEVLSGPGMPGPGPVGREEGRAQLSQDGPPTAEPVDLVLEDSDISQMPVLPLLEAISQKLWISYTSSGAAFCVQCDCPQILLPLLPPGNSSKGTYKFYPRHFHDDPFHKDNALVHFLTVHRKGFKDGAVEMLRDHGRRVILERADGEPILDTWALAAHNSSAAARFWQLLPAWEELQGQHSEIQNHVQRRKSRVPRSLDACRKIASAALVPSQSFVFPIKNAGRWAVVCTHPECPSPFFKAQPLKKDLAITHFRTHGVFLQTKEEVLEVFGFRVLEDGQPPSDEGGGPRIITSEEKREQTQTVHHEAGVEEPRHVCKECQTCVSKHGSRDEQLPEKQVDMSDVPPECGDPVEWPFDRLKEDLLKLPPVSKGFDWGIMRMKFEEQLRADDERRQRAAARSSKQGPAQKALEADLHHGHEIADPEFSKKLKNPPDTATPEDHGAKSSRKGRAVSLEPHTTEISHEVPPRAASEEVNDTCPKSSTAKPRARGRPRKTLIPPSRLSTFAVSGPAKTNLPVRNARRASSYDGFYKEARHKEPSSSKIPMGKIPELPDQAEDVAGSRAKPKT